MASTSAWTSAQALWGKKIEWTGAIQILKKIFFYYIYKSVCNIDSHESVENVSASLVYWKSMGFRHIFILIIFKLNLSELVFYQCQSIAKGDSDQ